MRYEGEAKHYCPNQGGCPPQIVGRIIHFIRRKAMDIEGLGEETVELLYENGLVHDVAGPVRPEGRTTGGIAAAGREVGRQHHTSIRGSVEVPFRRVLFGLGIRFVGETTAKYLAEHFRSLDAVMRATRELVQADEVGGRIADAIIEYFADEQNLPSSAACVPRGLKFEGGGAGAGVRSLAGRSFVVSGKFSRSRDEMKELIEMHGGQEPRGRIGQRRLHRGGRQHGPGEAQEGREAGREDHFRRGSSSPWSAGRKAPAANGTEADSATTANTGGRNNGAPPRRKAGTANPSNKGELF